MSHSHSSSQPQKSALKIAFFGTPQFSVPILSSIYQNFEVILVVSQPDKPVGKGLQLTPSPVSKFARDNHLPLLTPPNLSQAPFRASISDIPDCDIAVVAAYGHILPQWLLDWPRLGCLNIHTSLLPKYRGASPITAALLNGDHQTGLTFMRMDAKMDQGPIISQIPVSIDPQETGDSLFIKISQYASKHINKVLEDYAANPTNLTPQDHSYATYTSPITKQDGYLDLSHLPSNWQSRIYAYHSWPGTWTLYQNKRLKLLPQSHLQLEGKTPTPLKSFLHGHPDFPLKEDW